ncbi:PepSY domain-containing protein [Veillonella agrestimuris]|uniref:PepSY domain-containing protein n=1 Tax=Veillonella agrestimuris TaxID=2941340 RepID=UPI00203F54B6|nr:PepSY domain-containing protein [Veillonella agrestimuris]
MKSLVLKGSILLALATFAVNVPVVEAEKPIPVQPTVAVVDENHAAIVGANAVLNAFLQNRPNATITEISFDSDNGMLKYEVDGFDGTGKYDLKYYPATNQVVEERDGEYKSSLGRRAIDPSAILPPAAVVNYAFAQTKGEATSLDDWSVKKEGNKIVYEVSFGTATQGEIDVKIDAATGELLSVKKDKK